ncbi:MAG: MGDG synthase family glycosyltransferase [Acidimicrobiales bacterium]
MRRGALILSGSIGQGHNTVARACAEALAQVNCSSETFDCMGLLGSMRSRVAEKTFRSLLSINPLYDAFHFSGLRTGSPLAVRPAARAADHVYNALKAKLMSPNVTMVIAVFATGAGVMGRLQQSRPELRTFVVIPDATAHQLWIQPGVQRYIVFSEITAGSVRQYQPRADIAVIDPPIRSEFLIAYDHLETKRSLGYADDTPLILLMGADGDEAPLPRSDLDSTVTDMKC